MRTNIVSPSHRLAIDKDKICNILNVCEQYFDILLLKIPQISNKTDLNGYLLNDQHYQEFNGSRLL